MPLLVRAQSIPIPRDTQTQKIANSTGIIFDDLGRGSLTNRFEFIVGGSTPTTLYANVSGCMRGNTCELVGSMTWSSGNFSIITRGGPYDFYVVAWQSTGWTTPIMTVNRDGSPQGQPLTVGGNVSNVAAGYVEGVITFVLGTQTYRLEIEMAQTGAVPTRPPTNCSSFSVISENAAPGVSGVTTGGGFSLGTTGGTGFTTTAGCAFATFTIPAGTSPVNMAGWLDCNAAGGYECQMLMWDGNSNPLFSIGDHGIGPGHFPINEIVGSWPTGGVGIAVYIFQCGCPGNE